jgi:hypothetical protein
MSFLNLSMGIFLPYLDVAEENEFKGTLARDLRTPSIHIALMTLMYSTAHNSYKNDPEFGLVFLY